MAGLVGAATDRAARAEAAALLASGPMPAWFTREDDPALLALAEGTRALINAAGGELYTVELVQGTPVRRTSEPSGERPKSLNLWEFAQGDGKTDDTAAVNRVLALAVSLGVRRIDCGGRDRTYLLGGPFTEYGTFAAPGGDVPFPRYKLRLYSDLEIVGTGARFKLAGGSRYPGGIFGHPFWHGERLRNVVLRGLVLDGNMAAQIVPPIPANTHDNSVWQHGNGLTGCYDGLEVADCVFRNLRGHGINLNWASGTPESWGQPQHVEVHHNEFVNIFTQACNAAALDTRFHHNKVHGDGFWVGGFDVECGLPTFPVRQVRVHDNIYDFRDGFAPSESMPQLASDSAEAARLRRRTRRGVTGFCPPFPAGKWIGTTDDVVIENETIYQGGITLSRFSRVKVRNCRITNDIYEDLSGYVSAHGHAIMITAENEKGITDCEVSGARIRSALAGQAINVHGIEGLLLRDNEVAGMRSAAVRLESCSGVVENLTATDFGAPEQGLAVDAAGTRSSAVVVYGGQAGALRIEKVRAVESRSGKARRARHVIYANVAPSPRTLIGDISGKGLLGEAVRDVNGTTVRLPDVATRGAVAATVARTFVERKKG